MLIGVLRPKAEASISGVIIFLDCEFQVTSLGSPPVYPPFYHYFLFRTETEMHDHELTRGKKTMN